MSFGLLAGSTRESVFYNIFENKTQGKHMTKIKPFVKWAGGKGKLAQILDDHLPRDFSEHQNITYIEPFVGGGAMMFHMIERYPCIDRIVINDINQDLMRCYNLIKEDPLDLIEHLKDLETEYHALNTENGRKDFYYAIRDAYNEKLFDANERAAQFIFLNHTCFNGLYRENKSGHFNVPIGRYKKPTICNEDVIMADHEALSKVEVLNDDYKLIVNYLGPGYNFIYFDPPYRPLLGSSNFKDYSKSIFGDREQEELKQFCDRLGGQGCKIMLSNSNSRNEDGTSYFEELYEGYSYTEIFAPRTINAFADRRKDQLEVLIRNY